MNGVHPEPVHGSDSISSMMQVPWSAFRLVSSWLWKTKATAVSVGVW